MECEYYWFYYSDLSLIEDILRNRRPPFIKQLFPKTCVLKAKDNQYVYVDIEEMLNLNIFNEVDSNIKKQIIKELLNRSDFKDKFIRPFFNNALYDCNWKKIHGVAVAFDFSAVKNDASSFDCLTINYEILNDKLKGIDIVSLSFDKLYDTIFQSCDQDEDNTTKVLIQVSESSTKNDLREINGSLVEVYWDNCIEKNGDIDEVFGISSFVIGPGIEIEREVFRRILAFYGLYFEPSNINDYIKKLSYQLYGLTYDWTDQGYD